MKATNAIAEILKREGVEWIVGYPVNPLFEACAEIDIRTVIVRQERTGLHIADACSRLSSGERIGVFTMQHGPGAENAFGGVAQAYGDSVPILVLPAGYPRRIADVPTVPICCPVVTCSPGRTYTSCRCAARCHCPGPV